MNVNLFRGVLLSAVLVVGCTTSPNTPVLTDAESAFLASTAESARYTAMAARGAAFYTAATTPVGATKIAIGGVTASSVRSDYFRLAYVTDGNWSSAWGPASTDTAPTLTFNLAGCYNLSGIATKVDVGVTFDVQVREAGGAWTTIATGLDPQDGVKDYLALNGAAADEARLLFKAPTLSKVLVCEVEWFGTPCVTATPTPTPTPTVVPTATPTVTPTATPTVTPTATPTVTPTATPRPECGVYATFTQGGWGNNPAGNNPGRFLHTNFTALTGGQLVIGVGNTITFTSAQAITTFLPAGGTPGTLSASLVNPTGDTSGGVLAGQLTALELNLLKNPGLANVTIETGAFAGMTIGEFHLLAETAFGGNLSVLPAGATLSTVNDQASRVNEFFNGGDGRTPDGTVFGCP
jgi:hypothetical protein